MKTHAFRIATGLLLLLAVCTGPAMAADAPPRPVYPHVNTCPHYEVDSAWPQKPDTSVWGAAPGITLDADGNVWLFTRGTPSVQVYAPDGHYLFGWGDTSTSHNIRFDRAGKVWTVDFGKHVVQKHDREGKVLLTLGVEGEPGTDEHHFFKPTDVAFASNGDLFVSDGYGNARIAHFDPAGTFINAWGSLGTSDGEFSIPHAIAIDSKDRIYVADRNNARIQVFDTSGAHLDTWKHLLVPWGIWITPQDEIWVCGSSPMTWQDDPAKPNALLGCPPKDQVVMKFDPTGKLLELATFPKGTDGQEKPGELNWVHGIAVDAQGNLYLGDINGKRIQKFLRKP